MIEIFEETDRSGILKSTIILLLSVPVKSNTVALEKLSSNHMNFIESLIFSSFMSFKSSIGGGLNPSGSF